MRRYLGDMFAKLGSTCLLQRPEMSTPHKIALVGFSSFERATFESFFRLAARRPPGYVLVAEPAQANLAVVNADDVNILQSVVAQKPCAHVMLIGNTDGGTGWATQKRPLNLMKVLTTVELMLNGVPAAPAVSQPIAPAVAAPAPVRAAPSSASLPTLTPASPYAAARPALADRMAASAPAALAPRAVIAPAAVSKPAPLAAPVRAARNDVRLGSGDLSNSRDESPVLGGVTRPMTADDDQNMDHILVVDDSDIALKFMRNRLTRFGFRTDLVNSGEEALGRMNVRPYKFVFLDVMMEGLDGYQTCRAIKQRKYSEGKPPVVVMLTSRGGTIDKIRGTLAGCDAYLTKPLNERDLIAVLAKHDRTVARGFQQTNYGASVKSGFGAAESR
jgi:two-component system, cell cycle response regulator